VVKVDDPGVAILVVFVLCLAAVSAYWKVKGSE
jgi:hypothetical protein